MKIYELLLNNRRPHLITPSREYLFFQEYESVLAHLPETLAFVNAKDDFALIVTNIIIESIQNFLKIEEHFAAKSKKHLNESVKPLFTYNNVPIYCPFLSISNNLLLANGLGDKLSLTSDAIDLLETYNYAVYESNLTSLVHVGGDKHTRAYYHYDFHTIYIINDQGRLDVRISLFDRHIAKPDYRNILERIKPVINAYYVGDHHTFIRTLYKEKLISAKLYHRYNSKRK